jgi:hypothetical protein
MDGPFVAVGSDDVLEVGGLVVLGEELGDQLAAAGDADLGEDGLDVVADRVGRQEQLVGDLGGAQHPHRHPDAEVAGQVMLGGQLGQPGPGLLVGRDQPAVAVEQQEPGPAAPAEQVDRAPGAVADPEHGPELVAEAHRVQELPAPQGRALLELAVELEVVGKGRRRGQPGTRVGGQPRRGVERHQAAEPRRGLGEDGRGVVGSLDPQHQLVPPPPDLGGHGHRHSLHGWPVPRRPQPLGWGRPRRVGAGQNPAIEGLAPTPPSDTLGRRS